MQNVVVTYRNLISRDVFKELKTNAVFHIFSYAVRIIAVLFIIIPFFLTKFQH